MSHVSAVLGRIRPPRRSPVPSVASVSSSHLVEAAAVLLRPASAPPTASAGEPRRLPLAAWAPAAAAGGAAPLWAARPGPTTWFG